MYYFKLDTIKFNYFLNFPQKIYYYFCPKNFISLLLKTVILEEGLFIYFFSSKFDRQNGKERIYLNVIKQKSNSQFYFH